MVPPYFQAAESVFCLNLLLGLSLEVDIGVLPICYQHDRHPLEQEKIEHPQNKGGDHVNLLSFAWLN